MADWRVITLICIALIFVEAKRPHSKRETKSHLCDPVYNNTNKIQCYCTKDFKDDYKIRSADCYPTVEGTSSDDDNWKIFDQLKDVSKISFTNTRGIPLKYIPKNGFKHTIGLLKLEVKHGNIETVEPFAFANLSLVQEIKLSDNQIKTLKVNAFAHHKNLTILSLDLNLIVEINRDVFVDLPSLEMLFFTSNKITTIHDRAFVHLTNLRELEIDRNNLFSLNSETFSGLLNLDKLDLSGNNLEVIGDNTFLPLKNLHLLSLDGNKIQMLDGKAFNGLTSLRSLSLAHNSLVDIDNEKIFDDLPSLRSLSLKENRIQSLKPTVMEPILKNFYADGSSLDVEDNNFPCDCRLDWFILLKNNTKSQTIKLAMDNLKCLPDNDTREKWTKAAEIEKAAQEGDETDVANNDYEYYDDTQLNGRLFYIDMRYLLNCTTKFEDVTPTVAPKPNTMTNNNIPYTTKPTLGTHIQTTTYRSQTESFKNSLVNENRRTETANEIANFETNDSKSNIYTTSRLATVSASPIGGKTFDDRDMASDEAKPDRIKAHRSIQDDVKDTPRFNKNSGRNNVACIITLVISMYLRVMCI